MSREHDLKTWPEPFEALLDGRKTFEVRKDDRGFAVGDTLVLREWEPGKISEGLGYTSRKIRATVVYIVHGGRFGLPSEMCVLGIRVLVDASPMHFKAVSGKNFPEAVVERGPYLLDTEMEETDALLDMAWGLLANVHEGDWRQESSEWQDAVYRWRDQYFEFLNRAKRIPPAKF